MCRTAALAALLTVPTVYAQSPVLDHNLNTWFNYAGDHPISDGWSVITEAEIRRSDFLRTWQQLIFREGAAYRFSPHVQVAGIYFRTRSARYGEYPASQASVEHRIVEQASLHYSWKGADIDHRFRLEQRWFQDFSQGEPYFHRYQDRTRYQFRLSLPIAKEGRHYLYASDEVFIHFGPNHGAHALNQNRIQTGIGYRVSRFNRIEMGYLNQYLLQQSGSVNEMNHTVRFQFLSNARLFGRQ